MIVVADAIVVQTVMLKERKRFPQAGPPRAYAASNLITCFEPTLTPQYSKGSTVFKTRGFQTGFELPHA